MTPQDCLLALCDAVDHERLDGPHHPEAKRSPSAGVPLAVLGAIPGGGPRACARWVPRDALPGCPQGPERTRVARLFQTHTAWPPRLLAAPPGRGVADPDGIAWMPPRRAGRSPAPMGQQGQRQQRWLVGGTRCGILTQGGWLGAWDGAPAHGHDTHGQPRMARFEGAMIGRTDPRGHAPPADPAHRPGGPRGPWQTRMRVATVWARRTTVGQSTKVGPRVWASCRARLAWTLVACNLWARWGRALDDEHMGRLSMAEFSR